MKAQNRTLAFLAILLFCSNALSETNELTIISPGMIDVGLFPKEYTTKTIVIRNEGDADLMINSIQFTNGLGAFITIENSGVTLTSGEETELDLEIYIPPGTQPGAYSGIIGIASGEEILSVLVRIDVLEIEGRMLDIAAIPTTAVISPGEVLKVKTRLENSGISGIIDLQLTTQFIDPSTNEVLVQKKENAIVETTKNITTDLIIPEDTTPGRHMVRCTATFDHDGLESKETAIAYVDVQKSLAEVAAQGAPNLLLIAVLIPVLFLLVLLVIVIIVYFVFIRKKK